MLNTLSGRLFLLTTLFVFIAEVLIFVPSVSRFREAYLVNRLERAQIASLALLSGDLMTADLENELLENAGVLNVVFRRDEVRQLILSSPIPGPVQLTHDLRNDGSWVLIQDAITCLFEADNKIIRVIGDPVREGGTEIEVTMHTKDLRSEMIDFGLRVLVLSAMISTFTALLLIAALHRIILRPIRGVAGHMIDFTEQPEDARRIIEPTAGVVEIREAEEALRSMQTQLTRLLKQKDRLAQVGEAVAKISHDLRNLLTTAQLFTDYFAKSEGPMVRRAATKTVAALRRAVNLCESTLAFGRAEEAPPVLNRCVLSNIVDDVLAAERLAAADTCVKLVSEVPASLMVTCDGEHMYRALQNLVRNARQAIMASRKTGRITVRAREDDTVLCIGVEDDGPGLPPKAREHLFQPFQGGTRKGGAGLGLAISAELVRGHGGRLELARTGQDGSLFLLSLPKAGAVLDVGR